MITVEVIDATQILDGAAELQISCDYEGLKYLQQQIKNLLDGETHVHLKTQEWAGEELSEEPFAGGTIINHLVIGKIPA
jgi:hypothetical protein